jgi:hypothetical protein
MEKIRGKGKKRGAEAAASNSTAKNDQKTESTLARFVGRFEILAGEKRFDRREGGALNVALEAGKERVDRRVSFVF